MTPRQRMRLRALGLQDDPLYWTRPVPISELTGPRTLRWQHTGPGTYGVKALPEAGRSLAASPVQRLQTPVSTALEQLINSLCLEEGWETSSPEVSPSGGSLRKTLCPGETHSDALQSPAGVSPPNRVTKAARVRFREEGQENGDEVVANLESHPRQHGQVGIEERAVRSTGAGAPDEFADLALRFQNQPVKVKRKDSGPAPDPSRTPHQGYQYTPHPVKGSRKSAQPGTPFPFSNAPQSRSPFERKQGLQPITEADSGSDPVLTPQRPSRDGSLGASSSGESPGVNVGKRAGFGPVERNAELTIAEEDERSEQRSPDGLVRSLERGAQTGRIRLRGEDMRKPNLLRTARSLDGPELLPRRASPERSAESVLEKRSPYLAPVRQVRTAGGGSGLATQRRDRLAQFAEYLAGQKSEGPGEGKLTNTPGDRPPDACGTAYCAESPSGTSCFSRKEAGFAVGSISDRRNGRGSNRHNISSTSPTEHPFGNGRRDSKPTTKRWVIGESRVGGQRSSALPELRRQRSSGTGFPGGQGSSGQGIPSQEWSWSKMEERRRRQRVSREQAWLGKSHQRMAHWMQDHFAALERIAQLTPSERVDAERVWWAAQAAAREHALKLVKLQSSTVTGLEEGEKAAQTEGNLTEKTEERP